MQRKWPGSLNYTLPHIEAGNDMPRPLRDRLTSRAKSLAALGAVLSLAAPVALIAAAELWRFTLPGWAWWAIALAAGAGWWASVEGANRLGVWWQDRATARFLESGRWE